MIYWFQYNIAIDLRRITSIPMLSANSIDATAFLFRAKTTIPNFFFFFSLFFPYFSLCFCSLSLLLLLFFSLSPLLSLRPLVSFPLSLDILTAPFDTGLFWRPLIMPPLRSTPWVSRNLLREEGRENVLLPCALRVTNRVVIAAAAPLFPTFA